MTKYSYLKRKNTKKKKFPNKFKILSIFLSAKIEIMILKILVGIINSNISVKVITFSQTINL